MVDSTSGWPAGIKIWPSPAKLNLFLHIVGRRHDGYHLLQTVFQILDYGDQLAFSPRDDGLIRLVDAIEGVAEHENLIWRAADLLKKTAGVELSSNSGADIFLKKILPMGGGLGGGSSNAATTLVGLNNLWGLNYPLDKLAEIGLQLGADVPVFVQGQSAWAEGVGEILKPLSLPPRWYVVFHPGVHISTDELFQHSELTRDCTPITIRGFCSGSATRNVFQQLVCKQQPIVAEVLKLLLEFQPQADGCGSGSQAHPAILSEPEMTGPAMTGTGSCVFLACKEEGEARNVLRAVTERVPADSQVTGFVARGVSTSPLFKV